MGVEVPAAKALEPLEAKNAILWVEGADKTGYIFSGNATFKAGEGEFLAVGQGDEPGTSKAQILFVQTPSDSGTSVSAEFEGNEAALGTAATKTSQEAFALAGSQIATVLNSNGGSNFLQLAAGTLKKRIATGEVGIKISSGSNQSEQVTITHNLNNAKAQVFPVLEATASGTVLAPRITERAANTAKLFFNSPTTFGATVEIPCTWIALG